MNLDITNKTAQLLETVGLDEEPFGIFYSDHKPEDGYGPKPGPAISRELETNGQFNFQDAFKNFSCFLGNIWLARKKKKAAYISREQYGCMGGMFYTGVNVPYLNLVTYYVSTGFPDSPMHGERYMPSPQAMRAFMENINPRPAPKAYCIAKPLSQFMDNEQPEIVIFFARPEVMTGLATLAFYTTGDAQAMVSPFGAGCTNIVAWPLHYLDKGEEKAVLGGFDPSARKFLKTDELTCAMPLSLYEKMLDAAPHSFLIHDTWRTVMRKVERSKKNWGE